MTHPSGELRHLILPICKSCRRTTASDPVYYDLYVGDGTKRRFLATNMTGALGQLVSITDARGVTVTPADMGVDIVYDSTGALRTLCSTPASPATTSRCMRLRKRLRRMRRQAFTHCQAPRLPRSSPFAARTTASAPSSRSGAAVAILSAMSTTT